MLKLLLHNAFFADQQNKENLGGKKLSSYAQITYWNRIETVAQKPKYGPYRGLPVPLHP